MSPPDIQMINIVHNVSFPLPAKTIKEMNRRREMLRRLEIAGWVFEHVPDDTDGKPYILKTGWDMKNTWGGFFGKYKYPYAAVQAAMRSQEKLNAAVKNGEDWALTDNVFLRYELYLLACCGKGWTDVQTFAKNKGVACKIEFKRENA